MDRLFNILAQTRAATDIQLPIETFAASGIAVTVALIGWVILVRINDCKKLETFKEYCESRYMGKETVETHLSSIMEKLESMDKKMDKVEQNTQGAVDRSQRNALDIAYLKGTCAFSAVKDGKEDIEKH